MRRGAPSRINENDTPNHELRQNSQHGRHQRSRINQAVAFRPQADDSETNFRKVLLVEKTSIHSDENVKARFNGSPEQLAVPRASPIQERRGVHFMPFQVAA